MKAFGGGDMLNAKLSPFEVAFNECQCIEYCFTRPAVVSVMAGCRSVEEIERAVLYFEVSNEEKDYSKVSPKMEKFKFIGNCVYCGHCVPCTVGFILPTLINILICLPHREKFPKQLQTIIRFLPITQENVLNAANVKKIVLLTLK